MAEIQVQKDNDRVRVTMSGELTVRYAQEIKRALLDVLRQATSIEVVLGVIEKLDTSVLQLFCSAHRTAAEQQKLLTVIGADQEPFANVLQRSGFIRQTGCRENMRTSCFCVHRPASK